MQEIIRFLVKKWKESPGIQRKISCRILEEIYPGISHGKPEKNIQRHKKIDDVNQSHSPNSECLKNIASSDLAKLSFD
jgi:hypothetical protein